MWSVLNPLGMMIIMSIVFSHVFRANIENFPVYLMCGQVIFNFFNEASTVAMSSILGNAALIKKVYVPKYLFPMSKVCSCFVNLVDIIYCTVDCNCCHRNAADLDGYITGFPGAVCIFVFVGNGIAFISAGGHVSGSSAFVWSVNYSVDVPNSYILSN